MAMPRSYLPSRMVSAVCWMAEAAVAHALNTLVKVMPVRPTRRVTASGLETSWLPPNPNWMSFQSTPASARAAWIVSAPISIAVLSKRPNGCRPTPMMATSFVIFSPLDRLERERDDLVALVVRGERDHRQFDLLAELQFGRVVFGETALDADHVLELHQADAERDEVLAGRPLVRRAGRESLRGPCDERAAAGQQHLGHLADTAFGAAPLDGKGGRAARTAGTPDELRILAGPGGDLRRKRYLLCCHAGDDNWKWHSRLERTTRARC